MTIQYSTRSWELPVPDSIVFCETQCPCFLDSVGFPQMYADLHQCLLCLYIHVVDLVSFDLSFVIGQSFTTPSTVRKVNRGTDSYQQASLHRLSEHEMARCLQSVLMSMCIHNMRLNTHRNISAIADDNPDATTNTLIVQMSLFMQC